MVLVSVPVVVNYDIYSFHFMFVFVSLDSYRCGSYIQPGWSHVTAAQGTFPSESSAGGFPGPLDKYSRQMARLMLPRGW